MLKSELNTKGPDFVSRDLLICIRLLSRYLLMENLPNMVAVIWSEDSNSQLEATNLLRRLISIGVKNPPINDVVQYGVVLRVVKFLSRTSGSLGSPILLQGHQSTLMLSLKVVLFRAFENFVQLVLDLAISVLKFLFVLILVVSSISEMSYCAHERRLALVPFPLVIGIVVAVQGYYKKPH
ncbi:unnamed protein product [Arabis nemorensis]|uniref:Uncharacterized protein n=1 Tax=Arabis nemorensis TaxID=586526 RepID=A0A565CDJ4_9BRAS|nr:unnamed protein product [Arabis nemorensis]